MNDILRYKRHSFEYETNQNILKGTISNNEKKLEITSIIINNKLNNIENFIKETLTIFLRIYWKQFHIKINNISITTHKTLKEKNIKNILFNLDNEHTPVHNRPYNIKIIEN